MGLIQVLQADLAKIMAEATTADADYKLQFLSLATEVRKFITECKGVEKERAEETGAPPQLELFSCDDPTR